MFKSPGYMETCSHQEVSIARVSVVIQDIAVKVNGQVMENNSQQLALLMTGC